ncbi:condensation domain-containing protein, partial [Mycobacterium sp. IS-3022]|uniref:condensation domain-containing protein n=1 Tax=Mycobacterium sp. IS-3022 TaxID=1772277 RepID=UPI000AA815F8
LDLQRVGIDDSFFDLGGDSVSAMRVIAAINAGLHADLPVRALFDAPTVGQLAPRINRDAGGREPLVPVQRPAVIPLSFAQSRLWVIDQLHGPSAVYHIVLALQLHGLLDADALRAALGDVVDRHETLRTLFVAPDGTAQQLVVPSARADVGLHVVDATAWSADRLTDAIGDAAAKTFDLATQIPLRASLFGVADDDHVLVGVVHHIAADGWSLAPLVRDLGEAYEARRHGQPPQWNPLPVQYVDYTMWQRSRFGDLDDSDSRIAAQLAHWEQVLAGLPERLQLPTDRPYPVLADQRGASLAVDWPAELQHRVREVAAEYHATPFMVMQAGLAVLLSRLSASSDVAVGFPIAGRSDPGLDELIGFFVNTLVLRVDLTGNPSFAELLDQVRRRSLAAFDHQDVPFELLVERLNPVRSLAHHPLVQVLLAWQNLPGLGDDPAAGLSLGDLHVTQLPVDTHTARMDLTFSLAEHFTDSGRPAGIRGAVEFRTDIFDPASIQALVDRFERVLTSMTADPHRAIAAIDVLDAGEHHRLDEVGNRAVLTDATFPRGSVPELFAVQVERRPEAVAVNCGRDS